MRRREAYRRGAHRQSSAGSVALPGSHCSCHAHATGGGLTEVFRADGSRALRNSDADAESLQAFRDIVEEAAKATLLLEDMLTLARADASRIYIEGSGLGLAIAKWIAEMHHADLTVTSELHKGTVFQLVLPVCVKPELATSS